jgi:isopenicillin N synthase-like dioxygenase
MSIPVIDFREFYSPDPARRAAFVRELGTGLEAFGFVAVSHHGIDINLLEACYDNAKAAFAMPSDVKQKYETAKDGRQRGYTSLRVEHAKDFEVPDLKEFWHVGRDLPLDHPLHASGDVPRNQWPAEHPGFERSFSVLYRCMEAFAHSLLDAVGVYLDLPNGYFRDLVHDGNSIMRVIHYPPLDGEAKTGAVRAAAHEDINLITVLPVSTQPGLELLTRSETWMAVSPPPGVMVCDTGDMMQLLTGGRLPSTTHRVVNPRGDLSRISRYSLPFFVHPHPDRLLRPATKNSEAISARDFLHRRLVDIGVV